MTAPSNPEETETRSEARLHVHDILEKMSDVMFGSFSARDDESDVHARPLHVAELEEDGTLWFVVSMHSTQVREVDRRSLSFVSGQEGRRYIHLIGRTQVVTDRVKIRALWKKAYEVWFPSGPEDSDICLLRFAPRSAEYWDAAGMNGLQYLFEAASALLTGTPPESVKGAHGNVSMA